MSVSCSVGAATSARRRYFSLRNKGLGEPLHTRGHIVVLFDGDAICDLEGIDSFENGETLSHRVDSNFLEAVRVEGHEDVAGDLVFVDLVLVLLEPKRAEECMHVVLVVVEQREWSLAGFGLCH